MIRTCCGVGVGSGVVMKVWVWWCGLGCGGCECVGVRADVLLLE